MSDGPVADAESSPAVDLMTAMDRVGDGFITLDRDSRVRFANAAAARLLGRKPADLVGVDVWQEFPSGVGSAFELRYREALASQTIVEYEERSELHGAWFSVRLYPSPDGVAVVFRDVSHLHELLVERRTLLDRLLEAEDRERARIAADIHDDSAQELVAVSLRLDLLRAHLGDPSPKVSRLLDSAAEQVASATARLRSLLFSLEPTNTDVPLAESIRLHSAHVFDGSPTGWSVEELAHGDELASAERSQALRIVKEALNNVRAHARASQVAVTITGDDRGTEIVVADDGIAQDPTSFASAPGHRGLETMRDRAAAVGGWCELEPTVPHGCTVRLFVPRWH